MDRIDMLHLQTSNHPPETFQFGIVLLFLVVEAVVAGAISDFTNKIGCILAFYFISYY
jgi:hypothetical protein